MTCFCHNAAVCKESEGRHGAIACPRGLESGNSQSTLAGVMPVNFGLLGLWVGELLWSFLASLVPVPSVMMGREQT